MRKVSVFFYLIVFLITLSACTSSSVHDSKAVQAIVPVNVRTSCDAGPKSVTMCVIVLSNVSSTVAFSWIASSSPSEAVFAPSSGSVAPKSSSSQIRVIIPRGVCPFSLVFKSTNRTSIEVKRAKGDCYPA